jgi:hypothetical protein
MQFRSRSQQKEGRRLSHETDVSAEKTAENERTRFSKADGDEKRQKCAEAQENQRPEVPHRIAGGAHPVLAALTHA